MTSKVVLKKKVAPKVPVQPATAPKGSGGSNKPAAPAAALTPFEKLAAERGVDLPAEQARANSQLQTGQAVGGTSPSTILNQSKKPATTAAPILSSTDKLNLAANPLGTQQNYIPPERQPWLQQKLQQIKENSNKPIIGLDGTPLHLKELSPWDALAIMPTGSIVKGAKLERGGVGLYSRELPGLAKLTPGIDTGVAANTLNNKIVKSAAAKIATSVNWKVLGSIGLAVWVAEKIIAGVYGGRNMGEFVGTEEIGGLSSFVAWQALEAGDYEAYDKAATARDEILANKTYWENFQSYIPELNFANGLENYRSKGVVLAKIQDEIKEDKQLAEANKETPEQYWERVNAKEKQDYQDNIDYHTQAAKDLALYESQLIQKGQAATRTAEKKFYEEQARFFAEQRDLERQKEEEDRLAIAEFWINYRKLQQQAADDTRASNLSFGLLK
jgi:hypothetical protein